MSYDYQKDLKEVVNKATNKYGSMEKAIFEMNGNIADLKAQVNGKQALLDLLYSAINKAKNSLESVKI
jgi:iron uptake system EfeUOB component EfeO/EfeM